MNRAARRWTEAEVEAVLKLYHEGMDYYEICVVLANGRTPYAIQSKIRKEIEK